MSAKVCRDPLYLSVVAWVIIVKKVVQIHFYFAVIIVLFVRTAKVREILTASEDTFFPACFAPVRDRQIALGWEIVLNTISFCNFPNAGVQDLTQETGC